MTTSAQYAIALISAWEATSEKERSKVVDRFVQTIADDHAQALIPAILNAVERELSDRAARRRVVIETAHEGVVPAATIKKLQAETKVVDTIIGGFRVRREGEIIDASATGSLKKIRRVLTSA